MDDDAKRRLMRESHARIRRDMWSVVLPHGHPKRRAETPLDGVLPELLGCSARPRYMLLLWAFARGLPYRRIERSHRTQVIPERYPNAERVFEHNLPDPDMLGVLIGAYLPAFVFVPEHAMTTDLRDDDGGTPTSGIAGKREGARLAAKRWLRDPTGAIEPPAPRPKRQRWGDAQIAWARREHERMGP